ncbi:hypothetical protein ACPC54_21850 [Kitasatospora sp. NPDC094028]
MRYQHRRFLAVAATATLVSGVALASAPAALAAGPATPAPGPTAPGPQGQASPVVAVTSGFPDTVKAGTSVEFTTALRNTADHQVNVTTGFTVASSTLKQGQLKLEFQRPGGTQWQDARVNAASTGGVWELDEFATQLHLAAGAEATYRLRLSFAADATPGPASAALCAVVTDPTLPPWQAPTQAWGGTPNFTVAGSTPAPDPAPAGLPEVRVEGAPAAFTAGGEAKTFQLVYANHTGKDLRILPAVVFQGQNVLRGAATKLEFQTANGDWLAATPEESEIPGTQLPMWLRSGSKDADVIALPKDGTRSVNVRLAFTKDAPVGAESVFANGYSLPAPGEREAGTSSAPIGFRIEPAAGAAGTPAPDPAATDATPAAPSAAGVPTVAPAAAVTGTTPDRAAGAPAAPAATDTRLASTGGGSSAAPMAITGATAIALGVGTLIVARRRKGAQGAGN